MANKTQSAQNAINKAMAIHPEVFFAGRNELHNIKVWFVAGEHGNDYAVWGEAAPTHCSCKAGENGYICYHRASVALFLIERDAGAAFCKALDASIAEREAYEDAQVAPTPIRFIHTYCTECGHYMLYINPAQINERHSCEECRKPVQMESEAQHLERVRKAAQERQERIKACERELEALTVAKRRESAMPAYAGEQTFDPLTGMYKIA